MLILNINPMQCKKGCRNEGSGFIVRHHYKGTNNIILTFKIFITNAIMFFSNDQKNKVNCVVFSFYHLKGEQRGWTMKASHYSEVA